MTPRQLLILFILAALLLVCSLSNLGFFTKNFQGNKSNEVIVALDFDPHTIHPHWSRCANSDIIFTHLYEGLTRIDHDGCVCGAIAEKIEISEDGYVYVFTLRESKWADGSQVTAYDFERSWKSAAMSDPVHLFHKMDIIKNIRNFRSKVIAWDSVGIKTLGKDKFSVTLEKPTAHFLYLLSTPIFFPIHADWNNVYSPTNGPFFIEDWQPGIRLVLQKNPTYWDRTHVSIPSLEFLFVEDEKIALAFLSQGNVDFAKINNSAHTLGKLKNMNVIHIMGQTGLTTVLLLNSKHSLLKNKKIRKALSLGLNRDDIVQFVVRIGKQATSLIPQIISKTDRPIIRENVDLARRLLDEGLAEINSNKKTFEDISIEVSNYPQLRVIKAIQEQWEENLGIFIPIHSIQMDKQQKELENENFSVLATYLRAIYPDPMSFLELFIPSGELHFLSNNEEFRRLVNMMQGEENDDIRRELALNAEKELLSEYCVIPLYSPGAIYCFHSNLKGIRFDMMQCIDFSKAYWVHQ